MRLSAKVRSVGREMNESGTAWTISLKIELTDRPRREDLAVDKEKEISKALLGKRVVVYDS